MEAMDMGTATWAMADADTTMAGAEATITVGDKDDQTKPREAALIGGLFSLHNPKTCIDCAETRPDFPPLLRQSGSNG
jgi:hypothetical protein